MEVRILPQNLLLHCQKGENLAQVLRSAGLYPDAPCGGHGSCGKCALTVDGRTVLACQTVVVQDCTVTLPREDLPQVLTAGAGAAFAADGQNRYVLAFDIGTTTLAGSVLEGLEGHLLATASRRNPQTAFGADVISRLQAALRHEAAPVQQCIRSALWDMTGELAAKAGIAPEEITLACLVGNTAMHHLYLGIDPRSLTVPPYMPQVSQALSLPSQGLLPIHPEGVVRVLPNIAGFVGADSVACLVATQLDRPEKPVLLLDIGTNGEIILAGPQGRMACSAAAGPAFEGAKISQGMRAAPGAIDRVWVSQGQLHCHVLGEEEAKGICGSGLTDAVAALLDLGILSEKGRMKEKAVRLQGGVYLTQKDIREVQLAKSAIRSGIELLSRELGIPIEEIDKVYLAGAFGNCLSPRSACRIGLLPPCLARRVVSIGNGAAEGAKACALSAEAYRESQRLASTTAFLELASRKEFQDCFLQHLDFPADFTE